jgi:hypothetical protein
MNPLIKVGYKNPLYAEDIPTLPEADKVKNVYGLFLKNRYNPSYLNGMFNLQ